MKFGRNVLVLPSLFMLIGTIATAGGLARSGPAIGSVFVKVAHAKGRSCPKPTCKVTATLEAGQPLQLTETKDDYGKVSGNGVSPSWALLSELGKGRPAILVLPKKTTLHECPKPDCKEVATLEKGVQLLVLDQREGRFLSGDKVGYTVDAEILAAVPPSYIPPATAPTYIPPAEPPKYIPPAKPPKYIPADAPPIYIPPAEPAGRYPNGVKEPGEIEYVTRPALSVRKSPKQASKLVTQLPGGAKVHHRKTQGKWIAVATASGASAPILGWVEKEGLRPTPPLVYTVAAAPIAVKPCVNRHCRSKQAKLLKKGDSVVSIDRTADGKWLLLLLPGQKPGFGWAESKALTPAPK